MRKKVKITPFQREILRVLARSERRSLPALLDDLQSAFPIDSYSEQLERLARSLGILKRMGCLYVYRIMPPEDRLVYVDEMNRSSLEQLVRWDEMRGGWNLQPLEPAVIDIIVELTQGGVEVLELDSTQRALRSDSNYSRDNHTSGC